jgi:hypothetical protein
MNSVEDLLGMIATESVEGTESEHYFTEDRNSEVYPIEKRYNQHKEGTNIPPIKFNFEIIRGPDGSYKELE